MLMYYTGLTGLLKLTKAQYDALETHEPNTKYIVVDNGAVQEYLGDTPIGGGGAAVLTGTPTVQMSGAVLPISAMIYGTAEEVN